MPVRLMVAPAALASYCQSRQEGCGEGARRRPSKCLPPRFSPDAGPPAFILAVDVFRPSGREAGDMLGQDAGYGRGAFAAVDVRPVAPRGVDAHVWAPSANE